jgi:Cd2+/Zn2+-exporting ATPase
MTTALYHVPELCCAAEEQLLRSSLGAVPGVTGLDFDLVGRRLTVTHDHDTPDLIEAAIARTGLDATLLTGEVRAAEAGGRTRRLSRGVWVLAASGVLALGAEVAEWLVGDTWAWLPMALALASIALGGRATLRKGLAALRLRTLNINLLMTIAVMGAIAIGHWPEAAMVTFLFALAEAIERQALDRARNAIRSLAVLAPEVASVRAADGAWRKVPTAQVTVGDLVRVLPGERLPVDGTVVAGSSAVNQAPITGESLPVDKGPGDPVYAGTINEHGPLEVRVTAAAGATTLDRIAHAVQEAQAQRAPTQRFVDQFARYYTPAVVVCAILVAVVPPLVSGMSWYDAVYRALVLLVIACPCALVLSTPVTVVSGLAAAARRGILVKGGAYLEEGRRLRVVALDKTGTLTLGAPVVTDVVPLDGLATTDILRLAASLNVHSAHPVARAVVAAWQANGHAGAAAAASDLIPATDVRTIAGQGVRGRLGGRSYFIGSHRLTEDLAVCSPAVEAALARLEDDGKTTVVLGSDQAPIAVLGVADTVRPSTAEALAQLHRLGVRTVMLTGDNEATARAIARHVGIDDVRAGLMPAEKQQAIAELVDRHGAVGMVGDGVNDAPALARATIGFAMGAAGSDTALETADVAFMDDDLRKLPAFLGLSRWTVRVLWQNIALAIGLKALFFALTLAGVATLWMAVFADMGTSLLVVLNGLRLIGWRPAGPVDDRRAPDVALACGCGDGGCAAENSPAPGPSSAGAA